MHGNGKTRHQPSMLDAKKAIRHKRAYGISYDQFATIWQLDVKALYRAIRAVGLEGV